MPGSFKDFFELEKYRNELGKDYKKITLYLCVSSDLELSEGLRSENVYDDTQEQDFHEDEIPSLVDGNRHIPIDEAEQIESDMKLAQVIQDEWDGDNITESDPNLLKIFIKFW